MNKEVQIEYKPNIDTLVKVYKYLLIRIPFLKFFLVFLVFFLVQKSIPYFIQSNNSNPTKWGLYDYLPIILVLVLWCSIYFRTLYAMKKNILKNKRNLENQIITFKKDSFVQEGETFKMENFWEETYKIKETNEWFLIYLRKHSALPIVKADLKGNQYNELKELFNSIDIKKSLK